MNTGQLLDILLIPILVIPILASTAILMLRRGWLPPLSAEAGTASQLEQKLAAVIEEIENKRRLHKEWEIRLLPEPRVGQLVYPDYPMSSPYKSKLLNAYTDDNWLPVSRLRHARAAL
jgi:hypothetical protein